MTPQEQGRFCGKCCKTVMDFSAKSPREVQQILLEHENEKLCGRFKTDQLSKPVTLKISFQSIGNHLSAAQVFFVALLFAFGTTLFSCTTPKDEVLGKLELTGLDSAATAVAIDSAVAVNTRGSATGGQSVMLGEVLASSHEHLPKQPLQSDPVILPEVEVSESKIPLWGSVTTGLVATTRTDTIRCFSVGAFEVGVSETNFFPDDEDTAAIDHTSEEKVSLPVSEPVLIYPNPTTGLVNLKFNLAEEKNVQAELFDVGGKLIRTILPSQQMQAEEREVQFDVGDLKPGVYLVRVVMGEEVLTKRVVME